jgi:hypothetical protein
VQTAGPPPAGLFAKITARPAGGRRVGSTRTSVSRTLPRARPKPHEPGKGAGGARRSASAGTAGAWADGKPRQRWRSRSLARPLPPQRLPPRPPAPPDPRGRRRDGRAVHPRRLPRVDREGAPWLSRRANGSLSPSREARGHDRHALLAVLPECHPGGVSRGNRRTSAARGRAPRGGGSTGRLGIGWRAGRTCATSSDPLRLHRRRVGVLANTWRQRLWSDCLVTLMAENTLGGPSADHVGGRDGDQ